MEYSFIFYVLAALMVLIGIIGVVLPALPGIPLIFAGLLLAAWNDDFQRVGWITLTVLGLLTVLSLVVDVISTTAGAKRVGASPKAIWGSIIGTVAGLFFMPIGLFVGPFAGALIGEYWHERHLGRATRVGFGTWMGIMLGMAFKLGLAFTMVGLFAFAWFFVNN